MAFGSVSDILLRITGDPDDAAHAIEEIAADLAIFGKQSAEAEVAVNTEKAKADLALMRERLESLDTEDAEPQVKVKIAEALVEIGVLEKELDKIDGRDLDVDVDINRGVFERMNALGNSMFGLTKRVRGLSGASEGLFSNLSDVGLIIGPFAARIGTIGQVVAILAPLIVSLGGALVALAASAGAALAAVGALGIALGGVFAVGIGFAIAAVARFKEQADTAGTPANALKTAVQGIGDAAKKLLPAVDPVFSAMASGLERLKPLIAFLAPAFKSFGQDAADAVRGFIDTLASPAIAAGIANLIQLAGGALRPAAEIAGQLFRIFLNIAQAAMPFLVAGLQEVAGWLKSIGDSTSDIGALRGTIGGLVGILSQWLDLLGAIGNIFAGVFRGAVGPGTQLVKFLTDGANALGDWVNSAEGQERIKQFFEDTMPLVKQLVDLVAQLVVIFIEFGQIIAPLLTPVVASLNVVLAVVRQLLALFLAIPAPIRNTLLAIAGIAIALFTGVGEVTAAVLIVIGVINLLKQAFSALGPIALAAIGIIRGALAAVPGIARAAWNGVKTAAQAVWGVVRGIFQGGVAFIANLLQKPVAAWRWVSNAARSVAGAVRGIFNGLKSAVGSLVSSAAGAAWHWIADAARNVAGAVRGVVSALVGFVKGRINDAISVVHSITDAVNAAKGAVEGLVGALDSAISKAGDLIDKVSSLPGAAAHKLGLASGVRNFAGGTSLVGEAGPELVHLPRGADVFSFPETRNILDALGTDKLPGLLGSLRPVVTAGGGGQVNQFNIEVPEGDQPDVDTMVAMIDMKLKSRGIWSP